MFTRSCRYLQRTTATIVKGAIALLIPVCAWAQPAFPGDPMALRPLFEQALAAREEMSGANAPNVAQMAGDYGAFLSQNGQPEAALPYLRRALALGTPASSENLASALERSGQSAEAIRFYAQAAEAGGATAARCFTKIAEWHESRGDRRAALTYYRKALTAEESASGKEDPRVAVRLNALAMLLQSMDDRQSAEALLRRALSIQEKHLGRGHPATGVTLNNLGSVLLAGNRVSAAERIQRRAIAIFESELAPENPKLAAAYSNLADVLRERRDFAEARRLYGRALAIDEAAYGMDHPEVAADLLKLADFLRERGETFAAEVMLARANGIYRKAFGPEHPLTRQTAQ